MKPFIYSTICVFFALSACQQKAPTESADAVAAVDTSVVQTGGIKQITIDGKYTVWTKGIGSSPRIKLLLLHGGPATTHEYFECFESFMPGQGIGIYEYDQLGSYYSDQPNNDSLWTTARFVEEVEQVRKGLGLDKDNFYLLGHSWGGILAMEYALKYQQHLKGLIVSNMMASIPAYEKYNGVLRGQMRKSLLDSMETYEKKNDYKNPVYVGLVEKEYYSQHLCRLPVLPDPVVRTFKHINDHIYVLMQGPSEFKTGGRLLTWDRSKDLPKITVPTLMIGAKYDTMDPKYMEQMSHQVKNGQYLNCPRGSHMAMWDDQSHYFPGLISFLKGVDAK